MSDAPDDRRVERRLAAYRPASPTPDLRARVLAPAAESPTRRRPWLPIAAGLTLSALLQWEAARIDRRTAAALDPGGDASLEAQIQAVVELAGLPRDYVTWRLESLDPPTLGALDGDDNL